MTDGRNYDIALNIAVRVAVVAAIGLSILYGCSGGGDNLTDCSRRNQPQQWDGSRWTCDKDQR